MIKRSMLRKQRLSHEFSVECLDEVVDIVELFVFVKFERFAVDFPHVLGEQHALDVGLQRPQLVIVLALVVGDDGDGVVDLEGVGIGCVVDQQQLRQVPVYHSQVLHVDAVVGDVAVLTVQSMVDELVVGVEVVQDDVGIARVACREDDHFEVLRQSSQQLHRVRTDVDAGFDLLPCGEFDLDLHVMRGIQTIIAVDEGLVEIKNHSFLVQPQLMCTCVALLLAEFDDAVAHFFLGGDFASLKYFQILGRHSYVFSGEGTVIFVELEDLGYIVDVVAGRVGVEIAGLVVLALVDLRHELLEGVVDAGLRLLAGLVPSMLALLEPLGPLLLLALQEQPLLLPLLVDVAAQIADLVLQVVQLVVQLLVFRHVVLYGLPQLLRLRDFQLVGAVPQEGLLVLLAGVASWVVLVSDALPLVADGRVLRHHLQEFRFAAVAAHVLVLVGRIGLLGDDIGTEVLSRTVGGEVLLVTLRVFVAVVLRLLAD